MNSATYLVVFFLILVLIIGTQNRNYIAKKIKSKKGSKTEMLELSKKFIEKECIIYTINNAQITGIIKEVSTSGILVEKNNITEAVNLDYVTRIREYPRNKKGKKKSLILD